MGNSLIGISETLLKEAIQIINENEDKLRGKGGTFNIFSILDAERKEVSAHSAFIYELINPNGSHKQQDSYLKIFMYDILKIYDFDFMAASVYKEKFAGKYGRLDLLIESKNYKIAIEVKVDAEDGDRQIERYYNYLHRTSSSMQQCRIYYLTLSGSEPSEKSYGNLTDEERRSVKTISFNKDILLWLLHCKEQVKIDRVNHAISQYEDILKKITGNFDKDPEGAMKELILKDVDTFKAAIGILSAVKNARQEILNRFIDSLKIALNNNNSLHGLIEEVDFGNYYDQPKNRYAYLAYLLTETQDKNINIYLCVELGWKLYFAFYTAKKERDISINWDAKITKQNQSVIKESFFNNVDNSLKPSSNPNCIGWDYFKSSKQDLYNFFEGEGEYNVQYLADSKILEEEIKHIDKAINEIIETVLK